MPASSVPSGRRSPLARDGGLDHRAVEHAAGAVRPGQQPPEHRETLLADPMQAAQFGERIGVVVGADVQVRIRIGVAIFSAADCLPRLSPPAASPASSAASSRSAMAAGGSREGRQRAPRPPRAGQHVAGDRDVGAAHRPHQVDAVRAGVLRDAAGGIEHVQLPVSRPASAASSAATTSSGASPARSLGMPCTAYIGLTSACVASAATPPSTWMHSAPTAKNRVATAAPSAPVAGSRTRMDQVMLAILGSPTNRFKPATSVP